MTKKEKEIVAKALDQARKAVKRFNSPVHMVTGGAMCDVLKDIDSLLSVLFVESEKKADKSESILLKKTTQKSPEWCGRSNRLAGYIYLLR